MNPTPYHLQFTVKKKLFAFFRKLFLLIGADKIMPFSRAGKRFRSFVSVSPVNFSTNVIHESAAISNANLMDADDIVRHAISKRSPMIEYEIKPQNKFSLGLPELWRYRELFYFFTWRDVKVKYKQAALGILWAILQPLIMMVTFTLIFSKALNVSSDGIPYPVFAISGLLIWNIFSNGLLNSANSMIANANIIKKIYFPRLIIPISAILTALVDFVFALIIYTALLIYYHQEVSVLKLFLYLPLGILLTLITTFGLGTFLSALNVKYRDFQYMLPFLIQFLLFANPVLYSAKSFNNPWINGFMKANPVASAIQLCRSVFTGSAVDWQAVAFGFATAFLFLFIGIFTFRKTEAYFADLA